MSKEWIERDRQEFENLSANKKKKEVRSAYNEAHEIKERVDLYVSPEEILPGINTEGMARLSENFKNRPVADKGESQTGKIGADYETPYVKDIFGALVNDIEKKKGKKFEKLKKLFENMVIIDLGAGRYRGGYDLARLMGAKGYIGVEPYNSHYLEYNLTGGKDIFNTAGERKISDEINKQKLIPFSIVPEDALTFLKRLPDNSVGVISSGTDSFVIYGEALSPYTVEEVEGIIAQSYGERKKEMQRELDDKPKHKDVDEYIQKTNGEIARVLSSQSAMLENESVFGYSSLLNVSEDESMQYAQSGGFNVIKKVSEEKKKHFKGPNRAK